jgi:phosphatidylglycerophosphate synthase
MQSSVGVQATRNADSSATEALNAPAPGRPREIEAATNLLFVHPASRALVDRLVNTPLTPNQVSIASVAFAGAAAYAYLTLPWPWAAFAGLACQFVWHVLDGADGDLARRTGRASPIGELVDGVCDHVSQVLIYIAFALILQRSIGMWAWAIAVTAGACHFIQANAYETGRKSYRHWVYGAMWMRQTAGANPSGNPIARGLGSFYLAVSSLADPGGDRVEAAMTGHAATQDARQLYRELYQPVVKASGILDSNTRTLAGFASMLVGNPLWFFVFEIVVLNVSLGVLTMRRRQADANLVALLGTPAG